MKKINKSTGIIKRIIYSFVAVATLLIYYPGVAAAQQISSRSVEIGSSVAGVNTTYTFNFTVPQSTTIRSASFAACTTAAGACTAAPGFASPNISILASQPTNLGSATGWTVDTAATGTLRLNNATNSVAPTGAQTVVFSNVTNPSATNSTFYIRISTFSDAAYTTLIDSGVVATSTSGQITVTAAVNETLTFTLAATTVELGALTSATTGSGTSNMSVATNAVAGYSVSYSGETLKSGTNEITAMVGGASVQNSKQFGINMMANTTPAVGSNVSGVGTGTVAVGYNTINNFKFVTTGDVIATSANATNSNTFTTSYIANVDDITAAGSYSTVINYVATANY